MSLSTTSSRLSVQIDSTAARLELHNPPLNVIDLRMMDELSQALGDAEKNPDIRTIILSGGKAFSAGVDVAAHTPDKVDEMLAKFHAVIRALVATPKITIAEVHGLCLGGGAELAMVCDMVYTAESAQWGFPEIKLGCYPPVACAALASLVGQKRAADLVLTGRTIDGREATAIGLATHAAPSEQLPEAVDEAVAVFSSLSPAALSVTKKAFYAWDSFHFDKGLARAERIYLDELMKTADAQEGIAAFMQKRPPKWSGQ